MEDVHSKNENQYAWPCRNPVHQITLVDKAINEMSNTGIAERSRST